MRQIEIILFAAILLVMGSILSAQEIHVASNAVASPSTGGWHVWYEAHIDPDNAKNMIICGSRLNAIDNAFKTFVYYSADGGETWMQAFEDKSSDWDGEQSCAYGVHGVAYLVSDATKVINGEMHHEQGKAYIYVSPDSGRTWKPAITTGWTDYSTSVVDTNPGPKQNRLYVLFNDLRPFYSSIGAKDAMNVETKNSNVTSIGMISYQGGASAVSGPFSSDEMLKEGYHASFPSPAFVLKDGSILTFFSTKRRAEKGVRAFTVEAIRTDSARVTLETPVKIVDSLDNTDDRSGVDCGNLFLDSAGAYDAEHDRVYFAYPDVKGEECHLFLTSSTDGGRTWSKGQEVWSPGQAGAHFYAFLSLAVNKDGVLGLLWQDKYRSGCWQFAASTDSGRTFAPPQQLGTCFGNASKPSELSTAYLWTSFFQADQTSVPPTIQINLRNTWNSVDRNEDAVVTAPDGEFRVVWADAGNGDGELRTAAIQVIPADMLISMATNGMEDVTRKTVILYGGDQSYDPKTKTISLDVTVRNDSAQPFRGPIELAVPGLYKDPGFADIANADNEASGPGAVWDISSTVPGGVLAPGTSTKPFRLKFHYLADPDTPREWTGDDILGLSLKVYAKP